MSVSIVIPNLDSTWVGSTLEALASLGAPGPGVEVVVVGRDAPGQVPRDRDGLVFVDSAERLNPAAARNLGVERARGDKILFTDADCRPRAGWIDALTAALEKSPIAGGAVTFPRTGNRWALADNIASFHQLLADRPAEDSTSAPLGSLNLAVTRGAWRTVGGFDEALTTSEDFDWVLRARRAGLATAFVPTAVVEHAAVRADRAALEGHARWYGEFFHAFRQRWPETVGSGPTWRRRRILRATAPLKAWQSALSIFWHHPELRDCWRAVRGVALFKRAWYRAVIATWPMDQNPSEIPSETPSRTPTEIPTEAPGEVENGRGLGP